MSNELSLHLQTCLSNRLSPSWTKRLVFPLALSVAACSWLTSSAMSLEHAGTKATTQARTPSNSGVTVSINEAQQKEIDLQLVAAKHGLIHKTVDSPGQVQPNAELSTLVSSPSAGRAIKVLARLGDDVKTGQVMAVIKSDQIGQVQSDLLQNVLQAKADIKQQEVGLKLDTITLERESILFKEQVSAKADLQAAQNAVEKDNANLASLRTKLGVFIKVAQERLTLLGAPSDSANRVITTGKLDPWVIIRAPMNGIVIERDINPGEMNDGTKQLFTVTNLSEVWLVANIFEKDIESVKEGQQAFVTVDSLPDHKFPARIVWVGDALSATTRTLPARANVANPQLMLKPNMFARMTVSVGNVSVLLVPQTAVIQKGDKTFVFVKTGNGTYQEREVTTGIKDAQDIQIESGLSPGEMVVARGGTALMGVSMKNSAGQ